MATKTKAITLVETNVGRAILETTPRYHVHLHGKFWGELHFNMTGFTGCYFPLPPKEGSDKPGNLYFPERSISAIKKEIAKLNREWDEYLAKNNAVA